MLAECEHYCSQLRSSLVSRRAAMLQRRRYRRETRQPGGRNPDNGSVPGPTLTVRQGSEILVDVLNDGDLEATVHWHGLRLENRYDGTHETQAPIPVGGRSTYRVTFPDPGIYWYHPHIREDYGQEMGLYGNVLVEPAAADYWPAAHREVVLTLDDVLIEEGKIALFRRAETTYAAMGRFGNVLLIAGEPDLQLSARSGEIVRLYLTNTANTRVFKVKLPGARMKLVGGDSGRFEHEQFVGEVVLAHLSAWSSMCSSTRPGSSRSSITRPIGSIGWRRLPSASRRPSRC
jgi:FtsP/CotA-like multicopper oxidase with cupredoxin domain